MKGAAGQLGRRGGSATAALLRRPAAAGTRASESLAAMIALVLPVFLSSAA